MQAKPLSGTSPRRRPLRSGVILGKPASDVDSIAFSPDGKLLATDGFYEPSLFVLGPKGAAPLATL